MANGMSPSEQIVNLGTAIQNLVDALHVCDIGPGDRYYTGVLRDAQANLLRALRPTAATETPDDA